MDVSFEAIFLLQMSAYVDIAGTPEMCEKERVYTYLLREDTLDSIRGSLLVCRMPLSLSLSPFLPNLLFFPFFLFPLSHLFLIPFFFFFLFIFLFPSPILFSSHLRYQDHRCPRQQTHRYRRVRKRYKKECVDDTEECMKEDTKEWAKENTEECVKESTKECVKEDTEERVKEDTEECVEVTTEYLANE